jgi:KR domain
MYEAMSPEDFHSAIVPKVKGAQSLDKALQGIDLDFFVMTSSISAVLGNPGQCNYSAANSFLDILAWQRNLRYQAGTSLVLPMVLDVGVVSENENIELSLSRKGMYGIDEQEMLRGFETAMFQPVPQSGQTVKQGDSQIILGLDPSELAKAIAASGTVDAYWYNDARLGRVRAEVEKINETSGPNTGKGDDFSKTLKAALAQGVDAAIEAIAQHVMKRCSSILLVPVESFDFEGMSIASYGLDSMIGAELRTWLFKVFGLDIPFQELLAPALTFKKLSIMIASGIDVLPSQA